MGNPTILFTDGSVNTKSKLGVGAFAFLPFDELDKSESLKIHTKQFNDTSSTKLELEVLLHALSLIEDKHILVYSDSQNLVGLPSRRKKLEASNFKSTTGKTHQFKDLYLLLFNELDNRNIEIKKLKGHSKKSEKSELELIFTKVDKAARKALREISRRF